MMSWGVLHGVSLFTGGPEVVHDLSNYMENWCYGLKDPPHLAHRTDKWVGLLTVNSFSGWGCKIKKVSL